MFAHESMLAVVGVVVAFMVLLTITSEVLSRAYLRKRQLYRTWPPYFAVEMQLLASELPALTPCIRFSANSKGERGRERPSPEQTYQVVVAGGSAAECFLLDDHETWPAVIEQTLRRPEHLARLGGTEVHVANVARSGVDTSSLAVLLEHALPRFDKIDLIIIMVGGSDVLNWLRDGAPAQVPYNTVALKDMFAWCPLHTFTWTARGAAVVELWRRSRQYWLKPVHRKVNVGTSLARVRRMRAEATNIRNDVPDPAGLLANVERGIRSVISRARCKANRLIVVRQPWFEKESFDAAEESQFWNGAIGDPYKEQVNTYFSSSAINSLMRLVNRRIAEVCCELGVEQVDLLSSVPASTAHYYDQMHFTPKGAAIVAERLSQAILSGTSCLE